MRGRLKDGTPLSVSGHRAGGWQPGEGRSTEACGGPSSGEADAHHGQLPTRPVRGPVVAAGVSAASWARWPSRQLSDLPEAACGSAGREGGRCCGDRDADCTVRRRVLREAPVAAAFLRRSARAGPSVCYPPRLVPGLFMSFRSATASRSASRARPEEWSERRASSSGVWPGVPKGTSTATSRIRGSSPPPSGCKPRAIPLAGSTRQPSPPRGGHDPARQQIADYCLLIFSRIVAKLNLLTASGRIDILRKFGNYYSNSAEIIRLIRYDLLNRGSLFRRLSRLLPNP